VRGWSDETGRPRSSLPMEPKSTEIDLLPKNLICKTYINQSVGRQICRID
jgi:hypothetical protein